MKRVFVLLTVILGGMLVLIGVGLLAIQVVPVDKSNPPVVSEPNWNSPETRALAERACFDCHSNQTTWPWYSNVAPMSWLVANHVQEGRQALNFSEWDRSTSENHRDGDGEDDDDRYEHEGEEDESEGGEGEEVEEVVEVVLNGEMPLESYLLLHPEARLTNAEKQALIEGFQATFGAEVAAYNDSKN